MQDEIITNTNTTITPLTRDNLLHRINAIPPLSFQSPIDQLTLTAAGWSYLSPHWLVCLDCGKLLNDGMDLRESGREGADSGGEIGTGKGGLYKRGSIGGVDRGVGYNGGLGQFGGDRVIRGDGPSNCLAATALVSGDLGGGSDKSNDKPFKGLSSNACNSRISPLKEYNRDNSISSSSISSSSISSSSNPELYKYFLDQVTSNHSQDCSWRYYSFDLSNYYPRPYSTHLLQDYFQNLKLLCDNYLILSKYNFTPVSFSTKFINNSAKNLLQSDQENTDISFLQENTFFPYWIYNLAIYNWNVEFVRFDSKLIVKLHCKQCDESNFLDEKSTFDPKLHKPWCCVINNLTGMDTLLFADHLTKLIENLYDEDETISERTEDPDSIDLDDASDDLLSKKRGSDFNIEENLIKLKKLRTFFITDEADRRLKLSYKA